MTKCKSFSPSVNNKSKILILGSMPGVKSLTEQQYYAHPQNRFWKIMALICKSKDLPNKEYQEKLNMLLEHGIALWDVIKSCDRSGSLDTDIKNEIPNDIEGLLKKYPNIKKIYLNGNKSYTAFKKYFPNILSEYDCYKMPSTSPANARYRLNNLYEIWKASIN